jgi:hypothetical protein
LSPEAHHGESAQEAAQENSSNAKAVSGKKTWPAKSENINVNIPVSPGEVKGRQEVLSITSAVGSD